jgi:hypothetical protein
MGERIMSRLYRYLVVTGLLWSGAISSNAFAQSTIWSPTATPTIADSGDATPVELGVKFRADSDGTVTGIRYYKSAANTGTHIGNLWSSTGTLLATATFTSETSAGWQQVNFSSPVSITAGTTYIASYYAPAGHYAVEQNFFTSVGVDNPPLHALAAGVSGGNGVYAYGTASSFPASTYNSSNYWVDVVFTPSGTAQGPTVTSFSPANGVAAVITSSAVTVTFNKPVDGASVTTSTFQLLDASNNVVPASVTYNSATLTATLQPTLALLPATNYTAIVKGGATSPVIRDTSGIAMGANVTWSFATANPPGSCPCTIWSSGATPGVVDGGDPSSVELGVRFRSDVNGFITGIRFYKSSANTGTHIGNLWTNAGALLATAVFTAESASGWQQVDFSAPVPVTAGTTYVASYFVPSGHYSLNLNALSGAGVDNAPLHVLADGVDGANGVYAYSAASTFPTSTYAASNYWVDVVFATTLSSNPPVVTSFSPGNGASNVSPTTAVTVTFNTAMDQSSINGTNIQLLDPARNAIGATVSYNSATFTATLQPLSQLASGTTYTVVVRGGGVRNTAGTALVASFSWSFATSSATQPPIVVALVPAGSATGVSATTAVSATFNKALNAATVNTTTFQLLGPSNSVVSATVTYNSTTFTATLQPASALAYSTTYTALLPAGGVKDTAGTALAANVTWTFTTGSAPPPPPSNCPCKIFGANATPTTVDSGENLPVELGVKFRSDVNGYITAVRFYKSAGNSGTHIGNLWTAAGLLLASATFTNETSSGWQQVTFASPVAITAGTTYVASYFAPQGHYSFDTSYFANLGVDNVPLHALANSVQGGNGVFSYNSTSSFPTSTYSGSNYWVDVAFIPTGYTTAPTVISASPANGSIGVSVGSLMSAAFSVQMNPATITSSNFQLTDASGTPIQGAVSYVSSSASLKFTPITDLVPQTTYTAKVKGTVTDAFGNAMGQDYTWSFTTAAAPANGGPGGPILVIASSQNPYSRFYSEILYNEGLNEFTVQDVSTVTAATLASYDVVILGEMQLAPTQVTMLTDWVNGGGRLIAMRPDKQLATLLGLTSTVNTLSDAYLKVNTGSGPGVGIVSDTIQFHGPADLYALNGATPFATLYSTASLSASAPAVTLTGAGAGQAAAFTYDLARSVVLTRQGNPAWSGQDRDGFIDPAVGTGQIRSDDLYWGNASFDPQPEWIDLSKVAIPQADEQQRLLANLILQMNANKKPLPRFWYFPNGYKAVVIMTGDDHGLGGTTGRFNQYIANSPSGCSVADWSCIRGTSYIWTNTPIPNYQTFISQGFEIANHTDTIPTCVNFTKESLESALTLQLAQLAQNFPAMPSSKTNRNHCVLWSDYDSAPQVFLNHGIRLDTSYYYWPGVWAQDRPGMFTGSGMPMRYADRNGNLIDVFQATTQMTDESGQTYPKNINTLLDNATGPLGYYGAFTANMHTDYADSSGSDHIVASAQARGVPVIAAQQMLTWLDARNASSFKSLTWDGSALSFTVATNSQARNLRAMVPANSSAGALNNLTFNGGTTSYTVETIKGVQYAVFAAAAGSYRATYGGGGAFSISGTLTGGVVAGVRITISGTSSAVVTSDGAGQYLITGLTNGNYTVTPSAAGYTFSPASRVVTISGANVTGVNFSSLVIPTYVISGTVSGAGGNVATVTLSGAASASTFTDANGNYAFANLYNGSYVVTVVKSGYVFTPSSRSITVNGGNVTGANFTSATATTTVVTQDTIVSADNLASSTSITTPSFSTTVGNQLLLAFIGADNAGASPNIAVTGVSGAGLTWELVRRTNVQLGTAEIWRAFAPNPLTNATVTANFSVTSPEASITVISYIGADFSGTNGSGAIGATGGGSAASGAPTASLVTTRDNSLVVGVGFDWDSAVPRVPDANQILIRQAGTRNAAMWVQGRDAVTPATGTTVTINDTDPATDRYNLSIVEIRSIQPTYTLSGTISGAGGNGATVNLTGFATATTTANASGNYSFTGLYNGSYTVTPSKTGYTFTPSSRSATISGSNSTVSSFTSTAIPLASLSSTSVTFGNQLVNTASTASVVVLTNTGAATLTISGTSISGTNSSNFARTTTCGTTLAVGASCNISITFTPSATGVRTATLSVSDNAAGSPHTVALSGTGVAPIATLSSTSVSFGAQVVNTTSAPSTVTLTNTGTASMTISATSVTGTNASDFTRTTTCGATLAAGDSCTFNITFRPSAAGTRTASLSITDSASGSPHTVALTGTGTGVTLSPASLTFASQVTGTTSSPQVVTLSNVGTTSLTSIVISFTGTNTGDFGRTTTCGSSLAAGASCTISVTFTPTASGARSATLRVTNSDPTSPQQVALSGTGLSPAASLAPTSVAFGNQRVNTTSNPSTVTLTNSGTATMSITSVSVTGTNASNFALTNACGATLAAGANCTMTVAFTPSATGSRTASISIVDNAPGSPHTVALSGTGTNPVASLSPTSLAFGNQLVNTTSSARSVTLSNTGNAPMAITGITITGTNANNFANTTTCGATLAAGANCTINVTFTPTAGGARSATLSVADDAAGSPHTVALTGTGTAVSVSPSSIAFGNQRTNTTSAAQAITLRNQGTTTLTGVAISLTGTNASNFAQTNNCGTSLAAGASCTINVTFRPTALGSRTGNVQIVNSDPTSPQIVTLTGNGTFF